MNRCNAAGLEIIRQGEGLRLIAYQMPCRRMDYRLWSHEGRVSGAYLYA